MVRIVPLTFGSYYAKYAMGGGSHMDCYQKMYYKLFNTMTDVIKELQDAQKETEEMFLSHKVPDNILHIPKDDDTE